MRNSPISLRAMPAPAFRWPAVFCALAVWGLGLFAVNPQLHAALHSDANHQDHTCAVTLFGHGMERAAGDTDIVSAPVLFPAGQCSIQPALPVAGAYHQLPPACGPPLC